MTNAQQKRLINVAIIAFLTSLLVFLLALWNPWEKQQLYLSNFLYSERPTENPVVVISVDSETVSADGLGKFSSWCRSYYVPVLDKLAQYEPRVVGLDFLFLSKSEGLCKSDIEAINNSRDKEKAFDSYLNSEVHPADQLLAQSLSNLTAAVIPLRVTPENDSRSPHLGKKSLIQFPYTLFYQAAQHVGHNRFFQNASSAISELPPIFIQSDKQVIAFSLEIVRLYKEMNGATVSINPENFILQSNGQIVNVPLEEYNMLINFREKPYFGRSRYEDGHTIIIPFMDFLKNPDAYADIVNDKIVLIGARFDSSEDRYFTPIDPANKQYGVMIHAQAIQTILDEAWLYTQSLLWQVVTITFLVLLTIAIIYLLRIVFALPALILLVLLYALVLAPWLFNSGGLILNLVYPPFAVVPAAIATYAYRFMSEEKLKQVVVGALGKYVNTGVATKVVEEAKPDIEISGEKKDITVMFTDIRDFTTISENLQPQSLVALLNEYLDVMTKIIVSQGGTVDKYEGDAIMAFFETDGGPHASKAAATALQMREALPSLNEKWRDDLPLPGGEAKPEIDFRVGLSSGEAIVGNIGTSEHIQYTAIGDIVNLGSRLESANKKYKTHVMIAEATYEKIKEEYDCRFLDVIKVKGKNKPVRTYELICPKGQLPDDQKELILAYNAALEPYFDRRFEEALKAFNETVLNRWPHDYLANLYAGRLELFTKFPPKEDWDFVYNMYSK